MLRVLMMDDRELLERAAKAAGVTVEYRRGSEAYFYDDPVTGREEWLPLLNDGQALRLLARLNLSVRYDTTPEPIVAVAAPWHEQFTDYWWNEYLGRDSAAATRRAIVRAAAALANTEPA